MFFILSKVYFYLTQPLFWLIVVCFWGIRTKNEMRRKRLIKGCFWGVVIMSNPLLINTVYRAWEVKPVAVEEIRDTFDVGIVLGGFTNIGVRKEDTRLQFGKSANRLTDALYLYKRGLIRKILISGGDGEIFKKGVSEADNAKDFILTMGVRDTDLLLETKSRNTRENAMFTKALLVDSSGVQPKCLLITSAFHFRRAGACFKKVGLLCTAYPSNFIGADFRWDAQTIISPDDDCLWKWQYILKEWIGYLVYSIEGYI